MKECRSETNVSEMCVQAVKRDERLTDGQPVKETTCQNKRRKCRNISARFLSVPSAVWALAARRSFNHVASTSVNS